MAELAQMDTSHLQGDRGVAGCGDGRGAAAEGPLSAAGSAFDTDEFLAFFWGLHLFGTDFRAVKLLVGTREVRCLRSIRSGECDSADTDTARHGVQVQR